MPDYHSPENEFLNKITEVIEHNISNERFGVSELANSIGMSRSNLLRKVKKSTKLSVSLFIRQVRLKKAMEILKQTSSNVSEVSFEVGFSSTSYFIKCFKDYYGYPPGEVGKRDLSENVGVDTEPQKGKKYLVLSGAIILTLTIVVLGFFKPFKSGKTEIEKSIAVLPFINDSDDSTNIHIINGLMESILNDLQKIKGLRVISRTSVEKYRNSGKTIPEIAKELNVSYFVEGSGQKIENQILLNIQLIEAPSDKHLWSEQFNRQTNDIFKLQKEVAKNIADKIQVIITPEEEERIKKVPTDNLIAYDYFLRGRDLFFKGKGEDLEKAIEYFKKAIEHDNKFAWAYADIAISYYYLDIFQADKKYKDEINYYADNALLYDSKLGPALVAKALFYIRNDEKKLAIPYLEKALEYNPNSAMVINTLADFYTSYIPNTAKYLEYALKGIGLDIAAQDSTTASYIFLHVSNALIQSGFIDESEKYINKSIDYNPENIYSYYVKAYILYAKNKDLEKTKELLISTLKKDTTRLDVLQEVGKICYYMRDYKSSYNYFKKFTDIKDAYNLDIYRYMNGEIGVTFAQMGFIDESKKLLEDYKNYAEKTDNSIYKDIELALYYSYTGNREKAIEHLKLFSKQSNYHYWTVLFVEIDPMIDNIKDLPEFKKTMKEITTNFWENHKKIKKTLEEKGLL